MEHRANPDGTYTSATITLDYTPVASSGSSVISVMVNGKPQPRPCWMRQPEGADHVFDRHELRSSNLPTITPTYASTSAVLLSVDFNLAVRVSLTSPPAGDVSRAAFATIGMQAANNRLIRVRGPLINSSVDVNTYTVYIRRSMMRPTISATSRCSASEHYLHAEQQDVRGSRV